MIKPKAGDIFSFNKEILEREVNDFAELTGDYNPLHMNEEFARRVPFKKRVVHGMLVCSLTSRLVGMEMSCPGALWAEQEFQFILPVFIGDKLDFILEVLQVSSATESVKIGISVKRGKDKILEGRGTVVLRYGN